jgi:hypothetical protein
MWEIGRPTLLVISLRLRDGILQSLSRRMSNRRCRLRERESETDMTQPTRHVYRGTCDASAAVCG